MSKLTSIQKLCLLHLSLVCAALILGLGLSGCASDSNKEAMDTPGTDIGVGVPRLGVGDNITITFSGLPAEDTPLPQEKTINEDGTITLPDIGRVQAVGKTPGELEDFIHNQYVPKIYTHLTVTIKTSGDRVYFVRGEVNRPDRIIYVGPITVSKAITSAGDFTNFANHRNVDLIRSNGKRFTLNIDRILDGRDQDPPVFPGDQIYVHRKLL
jgi:polysaccharide export outer membrane protein